jgi:competence protein ComGC
MRILAILMILTLSSCMVSQKTFDEKCCKMEAQIQELESRCNGFDMKEQLLRQAIKDLQIKSDTINE